MTTSGRVVAERARRRRLHHIPMRHEPRARRCASEDQLSGPLANVWRALDADENSKLHAVDLAEVDYSVSHGAELDDAVERERVQPRDVDDVVPRCRFGEPVERGDQPMSRAAVGTHGDTERRWNGTKLNRSARRRKVRSRHERQAGQRDARYGIRRGLARRTRWLSRALDPGGEPSRPDQPSNGYEHTGREAGESPVV